jgi:nucleotide-binding universal stress UspA family protein
VAVRVPIRKRASVELGYARLLVAIVPGAAADLAVDLACRLARERRAEVRILTVIEVPTLLPLDAHMVAEEAEAHRLLERTSAIADSYGLGVSTAVARSRDAAGTIVDEARKAGSELIVLTANQSQRVGAARVAGATVDHVMRQAPCRVMLVRE